MVQVVSSDDDDVVKVRDPRTKTDQEREKWEIRDQNGTVKNLRISDQFELVGPWIHGQSDTNES